MKIEQLDNLVIIGTFDPSKAGEPDIIKSGDKETVLEVLTHEQARKEIVEIGIDNFTNNSYRDGGSFDLTYGDVQYFYKIASAKVLAYRPYVLKYTTIK